MQRLWWQLPGPSRYVGRVVEQLREGKNVILCLPEHSPDGIENAVRTALGNTDQWSWTALHVNKPGIEPAQLLFSRFLPGVSAHALRNAHTLSNEEAFSGKLIWVDGLNSGAWPAWKSFIADYAHACRSRSLLDRSLFCLCLAGELSLDLPGEDVCLSYQHWQGIVDNIDMLLFTSTLLREKRMPDLHKHVATAILVKLALWDPAVSQRLANEGMARILNPAPILKEIAIERGWVFPDGRLLTPLWYTGARHFFDGKERIHSAILAIDDPLKELQHRIWSAEVGVIFPLIEEKRQELIDILAGILNHRDKSDLQDMEFGQLEFEITRNNARVPSGVRKLVRRLKDIRNCLAHLEPLSPDSLLCNELKVLK